MATKKEPRAATQRADARRNRERIMQTAFAVFAEKGVDAQMTDIAAAAGLGVATLYRNFPTKEAMVHALALGRMVRCVEVVQEVTAEERAWTALTRCFQFITNLQLENRVFAQFLSGRIAGSPDLNEKRDELYALVDALVHRAQADGDLRSDVNASDVRMALVALARVSLTESPIAQRLVRRFVSILTDGFRAPGAERLEGPPLTIAESEYAFSVDAQADQPAPPFKRGRRSWPS